MFYWLFFSVWRNFTVHPIDAVLSTRRSIDPAKSPVMLTGRPFLETERNLTMNRSYLSALTIALATLSAGHALASDASAPKTREQVKAELAEAIRTGDIVVNGETGQKANEMFPGLYPAKPVVQGKTREQVKAELAEAIRTGDIVVNGETGQKANEMFPGLYPAKPVVQGKTREQVKAELAEAIRTGQMPVITY
jgi:predicted RNase H-like HicB family nuclease